MEFDEFAEAVKRHFDKMSKKELFIVDIKKNEIYNLYLQSFPSGTNEIYKQNTQHECSKCKNFIRDVGGIVYIENGKMVSIWDVEVKDEYSVVTKTLSDFIKTKKIKNVFAKTNSQIGEEVTYQETKNKTIEWHHLNCILPSQFVKDKKQIGKFFNDRKTMVIPFKKGLETITEESIKIVIDLVGQRLYRGTQFLEEIKSFQTLKEKYSKITTEQKKDIFIWENSTKIGALLASHLPGEMLLIPISTGTPVTEAVKMYEAAARQYKVTTAPVTDNQVEKTWERIQEMGIENSLYSRHATIEDISVPDKIWTNASVTPKLKGGLKESLLKDTKKTKSEKTFDRVEEISIENFIQNVLPKATDVEVYFKNKNRHCLFSLIAPLYPDSPNIFQWQKNFRWTYKGDRADSIKEMVKEAGGKVDGFLGLRLRWFKTDDYDIHLLEPAQPVVNPKTGITEQIRNHIHYKNRKPYIHPSSGQLDVDANSPSSELTKRPVENIVYTDPSLMPDGEYEVYVNNYYYRESGNDGFIFEYENENKITELRYSRVILQGVNVPVLKFTMLKGKVIKVDIDSLMEKEDQPNEIWNIKTETFHPVSMICLSPNFWNGQTYGNKHYFFILNGCKNPDEIKGMHNEFLKSEFTQDRKVMSLIAEKLKVEYSDNQLSGLGFSSTQPDELIVKVSGTFDRTLKIKF